jgi:hypothetical protein
MHRVRWGLPLAIVVVAVGWVIAGHVERVRAQNMATSFLARLHQSQAAFRAAAGGFAASVGSLTEACPGGGGPWLDAAELDGLDDAGYEVRLRARAGARTVGPDCHGQPLADDYYVAVQPVSARASGLHAYGSTGDRRIYVFVDGVAPAERDMAPGGLATPLEDLATFRIP